MLKTKKRSLCLILSLVMLLAMVMTASAAWDGVTSADPTWNEAGQYYEISTPEQLAGMRDWINGDTNYAEDYRLTTDIDLGGNEWLPITTFRGIFDGDGYTVSNFQITSEENRALEYFGFFGRSYGNIKNTGVTGFVIDIKDSRLATNTGGLVGYNSGGIIENCFAVDGTISVHTLRSMNVYVGGLVGYNNAGVISKSYAAVEVSGSTSLTLIAGGFIGNNLTGDIIECYATGDVTGQGISTSSSPRIGGFAGVNNAGDIKDCYATGNAEMLTSASTENYIGGFVGYNYTGSDIASSYSYGVVSADAPSSTYWGGFVGRNYSATISVSCGWYDVDQPASINRGIGTDNRAQGANVVAMTDMSSTTSKAAFVAQGWDFDDIWCYTALDGEEKPALRAFFNSVDVNGVASELNANVITFSPALVTIDGAGTYTVEVNAGGYDIDSITLDTTNLADGITATVNGNTITVTVSDSAADAIDCTLGVTLTINGVEQPTKTLTITTGSSKGGSTPSSYGSGGSSNCNAGMGASALLTLLGLAFVVKKR